MAVDPFTNEEQKRRLREYGERTRKMSEQYVPGDSAFNGRLAPRQGDEPFFQQQPAAQPVPQVVPAAAALSTLRAKNPAQQEAAFDAGQQRAQTYEDWQTAAGANIAAQEAQLTQNGVHRIRRGKGKFGETVYEDVSPRNSLIVGDAEEQMYGANSQRVGRGLQRPGAPAGGFDAYGTAGEQQEATNQYYAAINEDNAPQLQAMGRRLAERGAAGAGTPGGTNPDYQYVVDERGNRTLLTAAQRQARGLGRPGTANADARTSIALAQFQAQQQQNQVTNERADRADERANRQLERAETSDLRRFSRDDPAAFLAEETAMVDWGDPEKVRQYFQSDRGKLTRSALDKTFQQQNTEGRQGGVPGFRGMGLQRGSNYGDLERASGIAALGGGYRVGGDMWSGATFDPGTLGLTPDALEGLIRYYGEENAQRERNRQR